MNYFFEYGIQRKQIKEKTSVLYRGYKDVSLFKTSSEIIDNAFISTSGRLDVAQKFAGDDGNVIQFKTKKLPSNTPFVYITKEIVPHSSEDEYVFLPGTIAFDSNMKALYTPNFDLVNQYRSMSGGMSQTQINALNEQILADMKIDLKDKLMVWYRAIYNRDPEVVAITRLPKTNKAILESWQNIVEKRDDKFEEMTEFIPEVIDLREAARKASGSKEDEGIEISRKCMSFNVHSAIVERKTNRILSFHYGIPRDMFTEQFYDMKKLKAVEKAIQHVLKDNILN